MYNAQQLSRCQLAISRRGEIQENNMAALLSAKIIPFQLHFFQHIAVAHFRGFKMQAIFVTKTCETHIGHNGTHNGVFRQLAARLHIRSANCHHEVSIHQLALVVYREAAVCIPIKCNPCIQMVLFDKAHQIFHMCRTAVVIDIHTVGLIGQHMAFCPQFRKEQFRGAGRRAICTIDGNAHTGQRKRNRTLDMIYIIAHYIGR